MTIIGIIGLGFGLATLAVWRPDNFKRVARWFGLWIALPLLVVVGGLIARDKIVLDRTVECLVGVPGISPEPGCVMDGYVFLGGNPRKQENWRLR